MDKKWWTLLAVCAGTFMLLLDVTIVVVALPQIQRSLHASFGDVQWVVDAYALTLASLLLTSGVVADRLGRRRTFSIGLVIFTLGSLLCGLAQSPVMLILSRSAQGVGGAIVFATSLALLAQSFHGKERGVAFGVWGAITGVAVALGPLLGGLITSGINWRGIFLVNVPIGIIAVIITERYVVETKAPHPGKPDWYGFTLLTTGLVSLVYALIQAGEKSWSDSAVVVCLILGVVLLAAFVAAELRVQHPMFDISLFRTPTFLGGSIAAFAMNGSLFAMFLYIVVYLQDLLGFSAQQTGLRMLVNSGAMLVAATLAGRLTARVPIRLLIGLGLTLVGVGLYLMAGLSASSTWTHLIPGFIVSGIGAGMVNPALASTAIGVVGPERSGMASGINSTFRQAGIAASIATLGSIFASSLHRHLTTSLASVPSLAGHAGVLAAQIRQGATSAAIGSTPPAQRGVLEHAIRSSFASGMNDLFIVTGSLALVGAVLAGLLIRHRDFVVHAPAGEDDDSPVTAGVAH